MGLRVPAIAGATPAGTPFLTPLEPPAVMRLASAVHLPLDTVCAAAAADHPDAVVAQPGHATGTWTTDAGCLSDAGCGVGAARSAALTVLGPAAELLWLDWA